MKKFPIFAPLLNVFLPHQDESDLVQKHFLDRLFPPLNSLFPNRISLLCITSMN